MKTFNIISLGCAKNLTDSEEICYKLSRAGYKFSQIGADILIINTCSFLKSAVRESLSVIKEALKLKKEGKLKKIIVCGCLIEREKEKIKEKFPEIDAAINIGAIDKIVEAIKAEKIEISPHSEILIQSGRFRLTRKHSAYLKIADGCQNFCSYCLIPSIRGRFRSKPIENIISEAKSLAESGAVEITLIAQDTASYGIDLYGRPIIKELLKKLSKLKKIKWIRLMYVYPDKIDRELLEIIKDSSNICHYIETPFQHISDNVLKKMNRKTTEKELRAKIDLMRKIIPDIAIRSTFLVGFPGESEKDFKKLADFVEASCFSNLSVFKYSREEGTPAYSMPDQLPAYVKEERCREILARQAKVVDRINESIIDKSFNVLMDDELSGRAYFDAPDIDGRIEFKEEKVPGTFLKARIVETRGYLRKAI